MQLTTKETIDILVRMGMQLPDTCGEQEYTALVKAVKAVESWDKVIKRFEKMGKLSMTGLYVADILKSCLAETEVLD